MLLLFAVPALFVILSLLYNNQKLNQALLLLHAGLHSAVAIVFFAYPTFLGFSSYLQVDSVGHFFFLIISTLYFATALYSIGYFRHLAPRRHTFFSVCMMLFVASMDGAVFANNLGLIWVCIETTTLATAFLINHDQTRHSLEASWKYIFICSVGIAIAFIGILLLFIAVPGGVSLLFSDMYAHASNFSLFWLRIAFVFLLCGFGTKLGLAPLHFWLPDAHSESPAPVSAMLSGTLLNTALVPIIRMYRLMNLADQHLFAQQIILLMGILSVLVSAVFIIRITHYKRILAYSSIENMGFATIALSIGGAGYYAAMVQLLGHSLIKASFFLTTGNVFHLYKQKDYKMITGLQEVNPATSWLWLISFLMLIAMPPSPLFTSEFFLVAAMIQQGYYIQTALLLILLVVVIFGLTKMSLHINSGKSSRPYQPVSLLTLLPQVFLLLCAILCGTYMPPAINRLISEIVQFLAV